MGELYSFSQQALEAPLLAGLQHVIIGAPWMLSTKAKSVDVWIGMTHEMTSSPYRPPMVTTLGGSVVKRTASLPREALVMSTRF